MVRYSVTDNVSADDFIDVLVRSGLAERRPVGDRSCIEGMISNADITATAWQNNTLVGVARSVTDFSFCCYVSDLAVDASVQGTGIGRRLLELTKAQVGPQCKLLLFSAPGVGGYYEHIGFERNANGWVRD